MSIFTGTFTARRTDDDQVSVSWRDSPSTDAIAEATTQLEQLRNVALTERALERAADLQDVLDLLREDFR